jgi:hypothetical protein
VTTQYSSYGFQYPQPTDPVREGAANLGALANQIKAPELFSGQSCLAGAMSAQQQYRVRQVVYNYSPATDGFGLLAIPLPFSVCCVTAMITPRNFRQDIVSVALAQEYCTVTNLAAFPRNSLGQGITSTFCDLAIIAWGF